MSENVIVEVRKKENLGSLKATAEVTLQTSHGELTISKIKIIHQEGKEPWIAYPDISYKPKGSDEYRILKVFIPSKRLDQVIKQAILDKYSTFKTDAGAF
ncbi:SpoVG family protein [bacterium]|nr:SpoVG family protein [bacterium]